MNEYFGYLCMQYTITDPDGTEYICNEYYKGAALETTETLEEDTEYEIIEDDDTQITDWGDGKGCDWEDEEAEFWPFQIEQEDEGTEGWQVTMIRNFFHTNTK